MSDQSPASFPRPAAPLVLLGASGLGQGGDPGVSGLVERMLCSLLSGCLTFPVAGGGEVSVGSGTMNAVPLVPDIVLFSPRVAGA